MARNARRGRRPKKGNGALVALGCVLLLVSAAAVGGVVWLRLTAEPRPELAAGTLCPVAGPRSVTVVLLDSSDDIPGVGRRQLTTYLEDLADGMPDYGLLELRLLDPATEGGRLVFSKCNPGNGANLSSLTAQPDRVRKRWAETFKKPLSDALEQGLAPSKAETSPIMETIQRIAVERFEGNALADVDKRLVIVSDMIEHGAAYSQYRDGISYERFRKSPAQRGLATDLHGADVSIHLITRVSTKIDPNDQVDFWTEWAKANGGRLEDVTKVQGAG